MLDTHFFSFLLLLFFFLPPFLLQIFVEYLPHAPGTPPHPNFQDTAGIKAEPPPEFTILFGRQTEKSVNKSAKQITSGGAKNYGENQTK